MPVTQIVSPEVHPHHEERVRQIDKITADVYAGTTPSVVLADERDMWARMCAHEVSTGDLFGLVREYASLYQHASVQHLEYFQSEAFAIRAGIVKEIRRAVEVNEALIGRDL